MAEKLSTKIKTVLDLTISEPQTLQALLSQKVSGYLLDEGWFESYSTKTSVGKNGIPIPWFTYPAIDFLTPRLDSSMTLLEYGAGNSTLYFSDRVKFVDAIEHHEGWHETISKKTKANAKVHLVPPDEIVNYAQYPLEFSKKYDIIIVDAIERVKCLEESVKMISKGGVIILDDSERDEYEDGVKFIKSFGYKDIRFWGMAPIVLYKKCTTIFYKNENCLGI